MIILYDGNKTETEQRSIGCVILSSDMDIWTYQSDNANFMFRRQIGIPLCLAALVIIPHRAADSLLLMWHTTDVA